ncbi:MAG TPA: hypothetical protein VES36_08350, partial [Candidatus Limnocylindrales bacterium]|nr:hypothetical protein [Candidatus Limnocylindrales bacterium]
MTYAGFIQVSLQNGAGKVVRRQLSQTDTRVAAAPKTAGTAEAEPMLESVRVSPDDCFPVVGAN